MNKGLKVYLITLLICFVFPMAFSGMRFNKDFMTMVGLMHLVAGILLLIIALVIALAKNKDWAKAFAIAGGLLLLTGTVTCSAFPFNVH